MVAIGDSGRASFPPMQPHTVLYGAFSRPISSSLAQLNLLRTLAIPIGMINSTKHPAIKKTFRLTHSHAPPGSGGWISWPRDVAHGQIPTSKKRFWNQQVDGKDHPRANTCCSMLQRSFSCGLFGLGTGSDLSHASAVCPSR